VNRNDGTTVLKSSSNCPKEYLASVLALRLGFVVPEMRVIDYNHNEWERVKMSVATFIKNRGDTADLVKLVSRMNFKKSVNLILVCVGERTRSRIFFGNGSHCWQAFDSIHNQRIRHIV